ncbi:MAG: VanZ family protein [Synergistales bacterium]|nr:VanZ family protein [Synergistales bacterium]
MIIWVASTVLLCYLTLLPASRLTSPIAFPNSDKVFHGLFYFFISLIPGFSCSRSSSWISRLLGLCLFLMGVLLEFAQVSVPGRSFSYGDMASNFLGVLAGIIIAERIVCRCRFKGSST